MLSEAHAQTRHIRHDFDIPREVYERLGPHGFNVLLIRRAERRGRRKQADDRKLAVLSKLILELRFAMHGQYIGDEVLAELRAAVETARPALDRAKAAVKAKEAPAD